MLRLSGLFLAGALLAAPLVSAPIAAAQAAQAQVLVVDLDQVYTRSAAGRDARAKLQSIQSQITNELQTEAKPIEADQKALGPRFQNKSQQQALEELQKDAALAGQYKSFLQRLETFLQKQELRNQELQETNRRAVNAVLAAADPVVQEILTQRGASIVVERGSVLKLNGAVDITNDVVARLDQRTPSVSVVKVDLLSEARAAQARQGQGGSPQPR